jgi:hypothetical protein
VGTVVLGYASRVDMRFIKQRSSEKRGFLALMQRGKKKSSIITIIKKRLLIVFAGITPSVRTWGWRTGICGSLVCLAAAAFYYAEFLTAPSSFHIYGIYYGLWDSAGLFVESAILFMLIAAWMRSFSGRLLISTAMAVALLVLNVAFAWTSGVFGYILVLLPSWLPQSIVVDYLSFVQFPAVRATLDFYYVGWLGVLFLLSMASFRSGIVGRLVHSLEFIILILLVLPIEVYLFDRREFTLHVMDAQIGTSWQWFTNADLLTVLVISLSALALVDGFVLNDGAARRLLVK